jgi:hypothetical protein
LFKDSPYKSINFSYIGLLIKKGIEVYQIIGARETQAVMSYHIKKLPLGRLKDYIYCIKITIWGPGV